MKKDKEITKVIFRKFNDGDVVALFPEVQYSEDKGLCMSYQYIGQHGAADYSLMYSTKPAKQEEYKDLYDELTGLGYNLKIIKKVMKRWFETK